MSMVQNARQHTITQLYPDLSLGNVHRALAYYYDNIDDFRSAESATA